MNRIGERDFRREELSEKYTTKILYKWDNGKFKKEYLKKLERNWQKWKSVSLEEKSGRESNVTKVRLSFYSFFIFIFFDLFLYFGN